MRAGLDVSVLRHGVGSGSAAYAYRLARAFLEHGMVDRLVLYTAARMGPEGRRVLRELARLGGEVCRGPAPWRWSPDAAWWLPVSAPAPPFFREIDVYHFGELHWPPGETVPLVAHVHDLTAILSPEHHTRLNRMLHRRRLRWIGRHAERVVAISESTRSDIARLSSILPERIDVTHLARGTDAADCPDAAAAERGRTLESLQLGGRRFVLCVGTLEPRKNHVRLVQAFERLSESFADVHLVIAGSEGWGSAGIRQAVRASQASARIHVVGPVSSNTLDALYRSATVFAYPSLYEGFGLPILEAMAAGAPVLTSTTSSMPEVAGDAAVLVDPRSVTAIRLGLERLLGDAALRDRLSAAGRERESRFTWEKTARRTIESYHRAIATFGGARD